MCHNPMDERVRITRMIIKNCIWRDISEDCKICKGELCTYVRSCLKDYDARLYGYYEEGGDISELDKKEKEFRSKIEEKNTLNPIVNKNDWIELTKCHTEERKPRKYLKVGGRFRVHWMYEYMYDRVLVISFRLFHPNGSGYGLFGNSNNFDWKRIDDQ